MSGKTIFYFKHETCWKVFSTFNSTFWDNMFHRIRDCLQQLFAMKLKLKSKESCSCAMSNVQIDNIFPSIPLFSCLSVLKLWFLFAYFSRENISFMVARFVDGNWWMLVGFLVILSWEFWFDDVIFLRRNFITLISTCFLAYRFSFFSMFLYFLMFSQTFSLSLPFILTWYLFYLFYYSCLFRSFFPSFSVFLSLSLSYPLKFSFFSSSLSFIPLSLSSFSNYSHCPPYYFLPIFHLNLLITNLIILSWICHCFTSYPPTHILISFKLIKIYGTIT